MYIIQYYEPRMNEWFSIYHSTDGAAAAQTLKEYVETNKYPEFKYQMQYRVPE